MGLTNGIGENVPHDCDIVARSIDCAIAGGDVVSHYPARTVPLRLLY